MSFFHEIFKELRSLFRVIDTIKIINKIVFVYNKNLFQEQSIHSRCFWLHIRMLERLVEKVG
jgi:hypothetical protein